MMITAINIFDISPLIALHWMIESFSIVRCFDMFASIT
jgi:hypothetical protein